MSVAEVDDEVETDSEERLSERAEESERESESERKSERRVREEARGCTEMVRAMTRMVGGEVRDRMRMREVEGWRGRRDG